MPIFSFTGANLNQLETPLNASYVRSNAAGPPGGNGKPSQDSISLNWGPDLWVTLLACTTRRVCGELELLEAYKKLCHIWCRVPFHITHHLDHQVCIGLSLFCILYSFLSFHIRLPWTYHTIIINFRSHYLSQFILLSALSLLLSSAGELESRPIINNSSDLAIKKSKSHFCGINILLIYKFETWILWCIWFTSFFAPIKYAFRPFHRHLRPRRIHDVGFLPGPRLWGTCNLQNQKGLLAWAHNPLHSRWICPAVFLQYIDHTTFCFASLHLVRRYLKKKICLSGWQMYHFYAWAIAS